MKRNQYRDDLAKFAGLFVIALVVGGLLFGLVYGLIGNLSERGIHLLATALTFGVLGTFPQVILGTIARRINGQHEIDLL